MFKASCVTSGSLDNAVSLCLHSTKALNNAIIVPHVLRRAAGKKLNVRDSS